MIGGKAGAPHETLGWGRDILWEGLRMGDVIRCECRLRAGYLFKTECLAWTIFDATARNAKNRKRVKTIQTISNTSKQSNIIVQGHVLKM